MAAEGVAGYTASPEAPLLTCCTGLLEALADLMRRAASGVGSEDAAVHAAAAAVNLSKPLRARKMLQTSVVAAAAACAARATAQSQLGAGSTSLQPRDWRTALSSSSARMAAVAARACCSL